MNLDGSTIAASTGGRLIADAPAGPICTDTRALTEGGWFLALIGDRFDGHDFLEHAAAAGAAGCVVSRAPEPGSWSGGVVVVDDTTEALAALGRHVREGFDGPVIGLTGSSGKTTTRALIALALSPLGRIHQTEGNLNNHLGVPMTLLATPPDAAAMVIEMGTSSPGEIEHLARLVEPTIRLIVNVGPAHLEELGGLDGVAVEKGALFTTASPGHSCCVNVEDERVAAIELPAGVRRITFGAGGDVSLQGVQIKPSSLQTDAVYETPAGTIEAHIPAPGRHVALNAAGALAVALATGVDLRAAADALSGYLPVGMRMRPETLSSGAVALNDAYNANPQSMEASLKVLAAMPGRRAAVLGDMLELGPDEAAWHERIAQLAGELALELVILVGPRMAAAAGACRGTQVLAFVEATGAIEPLRAWLQQGDVVLLKGSRGARVEQVLQGLTGEPGSRGSH
ncbi:MAG TPA: UDP-N-acetylmuramoyl-tripeptide--D-alanyl-D-alanine ligase [Deltaproteobacteria bacterium]|nr:UDP-N-acetylmuramoyl-tripeptide--D-alanyl-D-alanine ligase [Deltaproteobacteria bacterium]